MNKKLDLILTELQGQKRSINYLKDQNDQALAMCDQTSHQILTIHERLQAVEV